MRILFAHNFYLQGGGEDTVFRNQVDLLRSRGHHVIEFTDDNHRIPGIHSLALAVQTVWSRESYKKITRLIHRERPDLAHFENTFPLISPSAYYACRALRVPVIQNLDNQRLICPAASFYRAGGLCMDCLGKTPPWPSVLHACYHRSRAQTAVVAGMLTFHRWAKTWQNLVDRYIASTEFYRGIFIKAGLPAEKIVVKPHFVEHPAIPTNSAFSGGYVLYIGRLDPEKGIRTLLDAWIGLPVPLKIRGSGQLEGEARRFVQQHRMDLVEFVGRVSNDDLSALIWNARFLVLPSEGYYETFGLVAVECYARGVPVIASGIGVMNGMIENGQTGLHFEVGDAADLARKALWLWRHPEEGRQMGNRARQLYEASYTPEASYARLIEIYEGVVGQAR